MVTLVLTLQKRIFEVALGFETSSCEEIDVIIGKEFEKIGFYIFFFLNKLQKYCFQKSKRRKIKMKYPRTKYRSFPFSELSHE